MGRIRSVFCLAGFSILVASNFAGAQVNSPVSQFSPYARPNYSTGARPALSPYLNLLRGGNPAANYFLGVLPEFERRANAVQFSTAIQDLEQRSAMVGDTGEPLAVTLTTGHPTAFGNTAGYFGNGAGQRVSPTNAPTGGRRGR
ncbi:MAG: hypothetical protein ACJ8FY_23605 [Gemmataceae bacterium]